MDEEYFFKKQITLESQWIVWIYPSEDTDFVFLKKEILYEKLKELDPIKYVHPLIYLEMESNWKLCLNTTVWNTK